MLIKECWEQAINFMANALDHQTWMKAVYIFTSEIGHRRAPDKSASDQ